MSSIYVSDMENNLPIKFSDIVTATQADPILAQVCKYVINGWPRSASFIKCETIKKYFALRESLSTMCNAVTYRDRVIVPPCYRAKVLLSLHLTHQGMARTKSLARGYVFWPSIDQDIEDMLRKCSPCNIVAKSPTKTLLSSWPIPCGPWERIHVDFAGPVNGHTYFVLVDAYSKWPEVWEMTTTTTSATIKRLIEATARFGVMKTIVSDNGPQFTNPQFQEFCIRNNITHLTTAPYHPMSNGLAERFVDTLKRALSKCSPTVDIQEFLRDYRATPHPGTPLGTSPAEVMLGRKMILPLNALLPPKETNTPKKNDAMERAFNEKHGAKERIFSKGERIAARTGRDGDWKTGIVIERIGNVMYNVYLDDGRLRRFHANQMRRSAVEQLPLEETYESPPTQPPVPSQVVEPVKRKNWRAVTRESPVELRPRRK